jgi:hypothetical protein
MRAVSEGEPAGWWWDFKALTVSLRGMGNEEALVQWGKRRGGDDASVYCSCGGAGRTARRRW